MIWGSKSIFTWSRNQLNTLCIMADHYYVRKGGKIQDGRQFHTLFRWMCHNLCSSCIGKNIDSTFNKAWKLSIIEWRQMRTNSPDSQLLLFQLFFFFSGWHHRKHRCSTSMTGALWRESTGQRWIPFTKGQWCEKLLFHDVIIHCLATIWQYRNTPTVKKTSKLCITDHLWRQTPVTDELPSSPSNGESVSMPWCYHVLLKGRNTNEYTPELKLFCIDSQG